MMGQCKKVKRNHLLFLFRKLYEKLLKTNARVCYVIITSNRRRFIQIILMCHVALNRGVHLNFKTYQSKNLSSDEN